MIIYIYNVAIKTPLLAHYINVVDYAFKHDLMWNDETRRILTQQWYEHGSDTCIYIGRHYIFYNNYDWFCDKNYIIWSIREFNYKIKIEKIFDELI